VLISLHKNANNKAAVSLYLPVCEMLNRFRLNFEYLVITNTFGLMRFLLAHNNSKRNIRIKYSNFLKLLLYIN